MVAVAKTGSGKTLGFLLPALALIAERGPAPTPKKLSWSTSEPASPSVLVLAPTRELALQIASEAEKFAPAVWARVVTLYGGTPKGIQVGECRKGADVVIATPGRLIDLSSGSPGRGLASPISLAAVRYLVLDEADQMLDMGFEPDIRKIVDKCPKGGQEGGGAGGAQALSRRQTLFFTATWPKKVEMTAASLTSNSAIQVRIGQGSGGDKLTANKNVTMEFIVCEWKQKIAKLKDYLSGNFGSNENAVVFAATKGGCDFLERELGESMPGVWCRAIHGDKLQWQREEMLGEFRAKVASGQRALLVATDVASRGLDIPGISLVVVFDFGGERGGGVEPWVHRIGRTGRAGKLGRALTFFTAEDKGARELVTIVEEANQKVPQALKDMAAWGGKARRKHGWAKGW